MNVNIYQSGQQITIVKIKNRRPLIGRKRRQYGGNCAVGNEHVGGNKDPVEKHITAANVHLQALHTLSSVR